MPQPQIRTEVIDNEYKYSLPIRGSPFKGLGVRAQQRGIDAIEQPRAAPAAAQREHRGDIGIGKRGMQVGQAGVVVSGQEVVLRVPRVAAGLQPRPQAEAREQRLDQRDALGRGRAGRRDHADEVAWVHVAVRSFHGRGASSAP